MKLYKNLGPRLAITAVAFFIAAPFRASAQTDEIQVYDGGLAGRGVVNLTWHNNFTPRGSRAQGFPGGLISDKSFSGVTEWALGVTDWFEAGLYLPLYSITKDRGPAIGGGKVRLLFAVPHADDRKFFYGSNFEFSYNARHWDQRRYTSEIRPIIGWHFKPLDVIFNPIFDNSWYGGLRNLDFAPATRIAYNLPSGKSAIAVEEYADLGPLKRLLPGNQQSHQIFAVYNRTTNIGEFEFGAGVGVTGASDKLVLKILYSRDMHKMKFAH